MSEHFFAGLDGLPRGGKPRTCGLTMVIDWGLGSHAQEDLLAVGADRTRRATGDGWDGKTALEIAEELGHAEVAALLRE